MRKFVAYQIAKLADVVGGLDYQAEVGTHRRAADALASIAEPYIPLTERREAQIKRAMNSPHRDEIVPDGWRRATCYFRTGMRVEVADDPTGHYLGGNAPHENARCPFTGEPWRLVLDLDCHQLREHYGSASLLNGLTRLPLYYGFHRPEESIYQIVSDDELRVIKPDLRAYEESPFSEIPPQIARANVRLTKIPRAMELAMLVAHTHGDEALSDREKFQINEYNTQNQRSSRSQQLSQVGGVLPIQQSREDFVCPNSQCVSHELAIPYRTNGWESTMKELALINTDLNLGMDTGYAKVVFNICWRCHTVQARYKVD